MCPRTKGSKAELPRTIVQIGQLGAFPVHSWSMSLLAKGHCVSMLGFRDAEETLRYKSKAEITLQDQADSSHPLSVSGCIFNGLSDALYRGKLPEVILVHLPDTRRVDFLNDLAEYFLQLLSMGFLNRKDTDPVALYVPCFVLMGAGFWYGRMLGYLSQFLKEMSQQYPVLTSGAQTAILARFSRGVWQGSGINPVPEDVNGSVVLQDIPTQMQIAGGDAATQFAIQSVCQLSGLQVEIENSVKNSVERLELQSAFSRLTQIKLSKESRRRLTQGILTLGKHRQAFTESESLPNVQGDLQMTIHDEPLLKDLSMYAQICNLEAEAQVFMDLLRGLQRTS